MSKSQKFLSKLVLIRNLNPLTLQRQLPKHLINLPDPSPKSLRQLLHNIHVGYRTTLSVVNSPDASKLTLSNSLQDNMDAT